MTNFRHANLPFFERRISMEAGVGRPSVSLVVRRITPLKISKEHHGNSYYSIGLKLIILYLYFEVYKDHKTFECSNGVLIVLRDATL